MKELSIEEKAKRYDEAINLVNSKWHYKDKPCFIQASEIFPELKESKVEKPNGGIVSEDFNEGDGFYKVNLAYLSQEQVEEIESLVKKWNPEIKESEDEKIRKQIISFLKEFEHDHYRSLNFSSWITWLKKHEGCEYIKKDWLEHIKQSWYKEGFINGKYSSGTSKEWTINDTTILEELIDFLENGTVKLQHDLTLYANWLKIRFTPIEKQGEQNHADKIEPKFHEGDWVVSKLDGKTRRISEVHCDEYNKYYVVGGNEYDIEAYDRLHHLWTIENAKDGDVLCVKYGNNEMPLIFTGKQKNVAYCSLNSFGEFVLSMADWLLKTSVSPATKEQRDLLFKKMQEADYVWNAEKKVLEKIEQTPVWNKEDDKKRTLLIRILEVNHPNGYFKVNPADTLAMEAIHTEELVSWLKSLKSRIKGE